MSTTSNDEPDVTHLAFSLSPSESRIGCRMETAHDRAGGGWAPPLNLELKMTLIAKGGTYQELERFPFF